MKEVDILKTQERYNERYDQFGYDIRTLGWGTDNEKNDLRFKTLLEILPGKMCNKNILDVGCGFGDFYGYFYNEGWTCYRGKYTGIDINPVLINEGKKRYPDLDLSVCDFDEYIPDPDFKIDVVVASGIFNFKLVGETNISYIYRTIWKMFEISRVGVAVNFLSTKTDFQNPVAYHTDPILITNLAHNLTKKFVIRHDYLPFEFTAYLYH